MTATAEHGGTPFAESCTTRNPVTTLDGFAHAAADSFTSFVDHEMPLFACTERVEVAAWVVRCLANPMCDGSAEAMAAIAERRAEVKP